MDERHSSSRSLRGNVPLNNVIALCWNLQASTRSNCELIRKTLIDWHSGWMNCDSLGTVQTVPEASGAIEQRDTLPISTIQTCSSNMIVASVLKRVRSRLMDVATICRKPNSSHRFCSDIVCGLHCGSTVLVS
ncbi:unnamed protein product [Albugo candida]|uniref:Uncharacterized protein n=1 Tax=Albugo candida TaxID=65357 RepID=A0A024FWW9_9STRA|nr:unnamed protein product [Albugo candida]|eukprot:CCI11159.1 unnamed protein product [Albugo candida]